MKFKLNKKGHPNIIRSSASQRTSTCDSGQGASERLRTSSSLNTQIVRGGLSKSSISQLRDNSLRRDNWNFYVGDNRFKTNFFLQFNDDLTSKLYDRHLLNSGLYSIRLLIIALCIFDSVLLGYGTSTTTSSLGRRLIVLVLTALALYATTKRAVFLLHRRRQFLMMLMPFYWSFRVLCDSGGQNDFLQAVVFQLPPFFMLLLIMASWTRYLITVTAATFVVGVFHSLTSADETFSTQSFFKGSLLPIFFYTFMFTLYEKSQKERFVIQTTSIKSKKVLLALLNQQPYPIALVNKLGQITFCNQPFETQVLQRLGINYVPNSIYKITCDDEENTQKLRGLIEDILNPQAPSLLQGSHMGSSTNFSSGDRKGRVEIKMTKVVKAASARESSKKQTASKQPSGFSPLGNESSAREETTKSITLAKVQIEKEIFEKFEMASVIADPVIFKSQKSAMLTFSLITEQKAKNRLMLLHSQLLYKFLTQFNKRLQQLYDWINRNDPQNPQGQSLIEFLGTTYVALTQLQQIQYEFDDISKDYCLLGGKSSEESFLLHDEILQCVESLSVKCLSQQASLKLDANENFLPQKLAGDVGKFRLALQSVVEFATKYCNDGVIDLVVNCDGQTQDKKCLISFDMTFNQNPKYNEQPLIFLLNSMSSSKNVKMTLEELLLQNYEEFFDLIYHFGMGMMIFPSLIMSMDGSYSMQVIETPASPPGIGVCALDPLREEIKEQDQAFPLQADQQQPSPRGRVKIRFKIPFNSAELSKKIQSPYFPFNPGMEENGGKRVYRSPLLKTRECNKKQLEEMKKIMEQNRTPLNRQGSHALPQVFQFKGASLESAQQTMSQNLSTTEPNTRALNMKSRDQQQQIQMNMASQGFNPSSGGGVGGEENQSFGRIPISSNRDSPDPIKESGKLRASSQNVITRDLVKRVESELKNFQMKTQVPSKDFFKNQKLSMNNSEFKDSCGQAQMTGGSDMIQPQRQKTMDSQAQRKGLPRTSSTEVAPMKEIHSQQQINDSGDQLSGHQIQKHNSQGVLEQERLHYQEEEKQRKRKQQKPSLFNRANHLQPEDEDEEEESLRGTHQGTNAKTEPNQQQQQQLSLGAPFTYTPSVSQLPCTSQMSSSTAQQKPLFGAQQTAVPQLTPAASKLIDQKAWNQEEVKLSKIGNEMPTFGEIDQQQQHSSRQNLLLAGQNLLGASSIKAQGETLCTFDQDAVVDDDSEEELGIGDRPLSRNMNFRLMGTGELSASKNLMGVCQSPISQHISQLGDPYFSSQRRMRRFTESQDYSSRINQEADLKMPNFSQFGLANMRKDRRSLDKGQQPSEEEKQCTPPSSLLTPQQSLFPCPPAPYRQGLKSKNYQTFIATYDQQQTQQGLYFWDQSLMTELKREQEEALRYQEVEVKGFNQKFSKMRTMQGQQSAQFDMSKKYVLIVEDNQMISMILEENLKQMGIVGIVAENGKIAVDKFCALIKEGLLFEFVLMDIIMPEMGGYEATTLIRKAELSFGLLDQEKHFICGFSAQVDQGTRQKSIQCGMNDLLAKPMSVQTLQQLVTQNKRECNLVGQPQSIIDMPSKNFIDYKELTILPQH